MTGQLVYVVAILDGHGNVRDIGPELFESEDSAWDACDRLNERRKSFRKAGADVESREYDVIKRRLLP